MEQALYPVNPVVIVDDEAMVRRLFTQVLRAVAVTNIETCESGTSLRALLDKTTPELVLLDLQMPDVKGVELLAHLNEHFPQTPVVVITGVDDVETAVRCMRAGSHDYLVKPVPPSRLRATAERLLELCELRRENERLRDSLQAPSDAGSGYFKPLVTQNVQMHNLFRYAEAIAPTNKPVLITGETGVGKELMARGIHDASGRSGAFVTVNMGGLDDQLISDTLFGHTKGAYTGAEQAREGLLEKAAGGTVFLDEIGDMSMVSQAKLLRLLQEQEYYPLGSDVPLRSRARVVAATHADLEALQQRGVFRQDLYYRLRVHHLHLPPLRERLDDLPVLVEHFMEKAASELGKRTPAYPPELCQLLATSSFPGNVRELEAMMFEAVSKHTSRVLSLNVFRERLGITAPLPPAPSAPPCDGRLALGELEQLPSIKAANDQLIDEAMRRAKGKQTIAARLLGISQPALSKRLKAREAEAMN